MDDKKKKFVMPEAELVSFSNEDIITLSATENAADWAGGEEFTDA